jgi:hypothetical protein
LILKVKEIEMKEILLSALFFLFVVTYSLAGDTIKIMPVGNSITAGEHYSFPALEERTGYRKALYEMLINAGYNVDFVGSQNHGIRPENEHFYQVPVCKQVPDVSGTYVKESGQHQW